jgi:aspartate 1-decarboxylase
MNFGQFTPEEAVGHRPRVVVLNEKNEVVRYEGGDVSELAEGRAVVA